MEDAIVHIVGMVVGAYLFADSLFHEPPYANRKRLTMFVVGLFTFILAGVFYAH